MMDPAIGDFLKQGILGAFIVLLLGAVGVLWKAYREVQDARIAEGVAMAKDAVEALGKSAASTAAMSIAVENTNRLNEQRLEALRGLAGQFGPIADTLKRLEDKIDRPQAGGRS